MQSPAHAKATNDWIAARARADGPRRGGRLSRGYVVEKGGSLTHLDHNSSYRYPEALIERIEALRR